MMVYDLALIETERLWWKFQETIERHSYIPTRHHWQRHDNRGILFDVIRDEYLAETTYVIAKSYSHSMNKAVLATIGINV